MSSSPSPVRMRVVNMPISTIVPSCSPIAHVLAGPKGARVHEDEPARRLADDARRADRHHQAEQHRQPLERFGSRARECTDTPSPARTSRRRSSRAGASAAPMSASSQSTSMRPDCTPSKKLPQHAGRRHARDDEDDDRDQEVRHRLRDRRRACRRSSSTRNALSCSPHGARVRKAAEHEAEPLVGHEQHERPEAEPQQLPDEDAARARGCRISDAADRARWPAVDFGERAACAA